MLNAQKPIRVLISDDHSVVRNGLKSFLTIFEDFELVGEARNGEQAVALAGMHQPDVILMDLMMPVLDGASATRKIKQKYPRIQIIALTSFKEQELVQSAIEAGAIGYLLKDLTAEELARAIRLAAEGKPTLSPEAAEVLIRASRPAQPTLGDDLTEREREVLNLIVEGLNNKQIAERLVVSVSTAKSHVSSILSKLGVSTRTEAVSLVLKKRI
jgi:NarL family two-component system response regulator LiaR